MTQLTSENSLRNLTLTALTLTLPAQINILTRARKEMNVIWDGFYDEAKEIHLIEKAGSSGPKSDAVKVYCEKLSRLLFDAQGGWQSGYSKYQVGKFHDEATGFLLRLANGNISHDTLFSKIAVHLFGFDTLLVSAALTDDSSARADLQVRYLLVRSGIDAMLQTSETPEQTFAGTYNAQFHDHLLAHNLAIGNAVMGDLNEDPYRFFVKLLGVITKAQ